MSSDTEFCCSGNEIPEITLYWPNVMGYKILHLWKRNQHLFALALLAFALLALALAAFLAELCLVSQNAA